MWTVRLRKTLEALGHEAAVAQSPPWPPGTFDVAILNLSLKSASAEWVAALREARTYVIGHAGHKESEKLELGNELGCDRVATNSEVTFKLQNLLRSVQG
ncbi:MAG: hypothetical protein HONBIEJF_01530 [Fimbriimonadaceae bacterium]|nr:hypothetical protein [Fimbriimonadaceae bacterium]